MRVGFAAAVIGLSIFAFGKPVMPGHIPGDRLVSNLTERLKKDPQNPQLYYLIGRAHYATFSRAVESSWLKEGEVEVFNRDGQTPSFSSISGNIYPWNSRSAVKDTADNRRHISEAIRNLRIAIDMQERPRSSQNANTGLAHLTLACTLDCGALLAPKVKLIAPYSKLTTTAQWRTEAAREYLTSFQRSIVNDSKVPEEPMFGLRTLVAYEAGTSFLRLQPKAKEARDIKAAIDKMEKLPPPRAVTPLILNLEEAKPLSDLLNPQCHVSFDLDGTAREQKYGWVQPTTAFLVWDPTHEGKITSGRQLFGNATWWMLWANAYAALDALDDNHDGWLAGRELRGLALWYDLNANGKSDPGEVMPVEKTSISALGTHSDGKMGESWVSSQGVKLKDGRLLPTYDWVVTSIR